MLARIGAMVRKEFIQIWRDPRTLAMVLALPVMLLLIFGYGINTVVDHLSMVVLDQSNSPESRALVAALQNSSYFDLVRTVYTQEELVQAIDAGDAKVGIHIASDFGAQVLRGATGAAQLIIDGSDPNIASTASFAAASVTQAQAVAFTTAMLARRTAGLSAGGIDLRPIVLYNPSMKSVNFMVPGVIGMILSFQTLLLTAFAVVREREQGTLEQIIVTPIRTWEFMLGKMLPFTLTASLAVVFSLLAARLIFGVSVAGSLPLFAALSFIFLLSSLGLGLFISTVSQTQGQAIQITMLINLPSILLSGFVFPRDGMPWIIRQIGLLFPMTYYLKILRGIILKGAGLDVLWPAVWPMALYALVVFVLSAWNFQKRVA